MSSSSWSRAEHALDLCASSGFAPSSASYWLEAACFPALLLSALLGAAACLALAICGRACGCCCCADAPDRAAGARGRRARLGACLLLAAGGAGATLWGNRSLGAAVRVADDAARYLEDAFAGVSAEAASAAASGDALAALARNVSDPPACPLNQSDVALVDDAAAHATTLADATAPLPGKISRFRGDARAWGVARRDSAVWGLVAVVLGLCALNACGCAARSARALRLSTCVSLVGYVALAALVGVEAFASVAVGDFCEDASGHALAQIPAGSSARAYAEYFASSRRG